ncbi:MAG TPA: hypothetical protein VIV60_07400, partial [Polyangiaceae bacterium]
MSALSKFLLKSNVTVALLVSFSGAMRTAQAQPASPTPPRQTPAAASGRATAPSAGPAVSSNAAASAATPAPVSAATPAANGAAPVSAATPA